MERDAPMKAAILSGFVAGVFLVGGCQKKPDPPEVDMKTMMATAVQPTAQVYWNAVQYISDEAGSRKIEPKTDAEWQEVQQAAVTLKALGEQMKDPSYADGKGTDWQDFAQGLVDVSTIAEKAAKERSPDKVFEVGASIYNVCSGCHEIYMPVPGGAAPMQTEVK